MIETTEISGSHSHRKFIDKACPAYELITQIQKLKSQTFRFFFDKKSNAQKVVSFSFSIFANVKIYD